MIDSKKYNITLDKIDEISFPAMRKQAHEMKGLGYYDIASDIFISVFLSVNGNRNDLLNAATCMKMHGNIAEATKLYNLYVCEFPRCPYGWSLFGTFLKSNGDFSAAISALRRSLDIQYDYATMNMLVVTLERFGKKDEATVLGQSNLERRHSMMLENNISISKVQTIARNRELVNKSAFRTGKKNVISFSLWGDKRTYNEGAIVNAQIAPFIYPGWIARFYCDETVPKTTVKALITLKSEVVLVNSELLKQFGPLWRFFVADDPSVHRFICRDADARLNAQEFIAVEEWMQSGLSFHTMRDHVYHMDVMLAGMWGGIAGILPSILTEIKGMKCGKITKFVDQDYLANHVWPYIFKDCLIHDSNYNLLDSKPFPAGYRLPTQLHVGGGVRLLEN